MLVKIIKNVDTVSHNWGCKDFDADESYEIPTIEEIAWKRDSQLLEDIALGKAAVSNGVSYFTSAGDAIAHLQCVTSELPIDTPSGAIHTWSTPRSVDECVVFIGAGDDEGYGDGQSLAISLGLLDSSKTIDIVFNRDIFLSSSKFMFENVPWGATITASLYIVIEQQEYHVIDFVENIPIYGSCFSGVSLSLSNERAEITEGMILRITVKNGTVPAIFKVWGFLAGYKNIT
jgi:hypothetical protein